MNAEFKLNGLTLITDRLILRPFTQNDLDDFFEYASVDGVGEMAGWSHHKNKEETQTILDKFIEHDKTFAVVYKENNKVIGSIGIELYSRTDALNEFASLFGRELGYVLSKDYWGKGLMTEAVKTVINYLFNVLNYDFLLCGYFIRNARSKRVQEKCGFRPYRKLKFTTRMNTEEDSILSLLLNPNKNIKLDFSHQETLTYKE